MFKRTKTIEVEVEEQEFYIFFTLKDSKTITISSCLIYHYGSAKIDIMSPEQNLKSKIKGGELYDGYNLRNICFYTVAAKPTKIETKTYTLQKYWMGSWHLKN